MLSLVLAQRLSLRSLPVELRSSAGRAIFVRESAIARSRIHINLAHYLNCIIGLGERHDLTAIIKVYFEPSALLGVDFTERSHVKVTTTAGGLCATVIADRLGLPYYRLECGDDGLDSDVWLGG